MRNLSARGRTISGFPAIGPMATMTISGFPARGFSRLSPACSGLQATGGGAKVSTFGTAATGDQESASTAELTTVSAIPGLASLVDIGAAATTTTTAPSP